MATNIDAPNICNSYNTHFQGLHKIHSIRWDKPIHLSNSWGMQNYKVDGVHLILPCKAQTLKKKKLNKGMTGSLKLEIYHHYWAT